ncbi:hypothetical protein ACFVTC_07985 [Streptomyces sp. NPDC057950]|uniref:hypothetical protein n=1 Tax=Streptomyces sp. NPDC057950 TaxID=3346288 RepID=UPI0036E7E8DD
MRRTARLLTGTALAVAAAGLTVAPAYGESTVSLEVSPSTALPGGAISVSTAACGTNGAATGDASAVGAGTFPLAAGPHENDAVGRFRVPPSAQPGTYEIVAKCSRGTQVTGDLTVTLTSATSARDQLQPRGHVNTGVGGALGTDPTKTAAGVAALAVAAAGGTWLLHRRARGDGI